MVNAPRPPLFLEIQSIKSHPLSITLAFGDFHGSLWCRGGDFSSTANGRVFAVLDCEVMRRNSPNH